MPSTDHERCDSDGNQHDSNTAGRDANTAGRDPSTCRRLSTATAGRRRFLGATAAAVTVGLAGCAETVGNLLAEFILDDVNLLNETDRVLTGSITVVGPDSETLLDDEFRLEPADEDADATEDESQAVFGDLFEAPGEHRFEVALDGAEVDGESHAELVGTISDPEEEHAVVIVGAGELEEPFELFVIEEFTDLGDHIDASVDGGDETET